MAMAWQEMVTMKHVHEYLDTLDPETRRLFWLADSICKTVADSLSEDFQIAAAIVGVVWKKTEEREAVKRFAPEHAMG